MARSLVSSISRIFSEHRHASWFLLFALAPFFLPFVFLCVPLLALFLAPASCFLLFLLILYKVQVYLNRYPKCERRDRVLPAAENPWAEPAVSVEQEKGAVSGYDGPGGQIAEHADEHHVDSPCSSERPAAKHEVQEDFDPEYEGFAVETTDQGIGALSERKDEEAVMEEHRPDAHEKGCEEFIGNLPCTEEPEMHGDIEQELSVHELVTRGDEPEGSLRKPPLVECERPEVSPAVSHTPSSHGESELVTQLEESGEIEESGAVTQLEESEDIEQAQHEEKPEGSLIKPIFAESERLEELEFSPPVSHTPSRHEELELISQPEEEPYAPQTVEGVTKSEEILQAQLEEKSERSLIVPPSVESKRSKELERSPAVPHTLPGHEDSELVTQPEEEPYASQTVEGVTEFEEIEQAQHEEKSETCLRKSPLVESERSEELELSPALPVSPSSHEGSELITHSEEEPYTGATESDEIEQAQLEEKPYATHKIERVAKSEEIEQGQLEEKPYTLLTSEEIEPGVSELLEEARMEAMLKRAQGDTDEPYTGATESDEMEQAQLEEKPYAPHKIERVAKSEEIEQGQPEEKPYTPFTSEEIEPATQSYGVSEVLEEARMEAMLKRAQGDTQGPIGKEVCIVPEDKDDVAKGETSSAGGLLHERPKHMDVETQDKVDEEKQLLADLSAIEKIVGYSGGPHASIMEQIDALYIFLGMEPLYWAVEVNDLERARTEIELLKVVVGVK